MSKENKNKKTLFNNFLSFIYSSPRKQGTKPAPASSASQVCVVVLSWIEKKLLNKIFIFVFFAYKKYSRSFIKLQFNHWRHMDYFNNVITTFLGLERGNYIAV